MTELLSTGRSDASGSLPDRRRVVAGGLAGAVAASGAQAADPPFPSRPMFIMAPANPGGGTDQIARLIRIVLSEEKITSRPVEVINRGGAAGAIGLAELVSRNHGNPYMVMACGGSVVGATIAQNSPFRATDAYPLARLTLDPQIVAVPADSPYQTMQDLVEAFRRDPRSVTWCGGSAGGLDHIQVGLIAEACGVAKEDIRYVAYAGSGAAAAAMMGGQVTAGSAGYGEWRGIAGDGRIRFLAVSMPERFGDKTIPTMRETGLDVVLENWRGVFAPPGLKPEHLDWWMSAITRMRASALWQEFLVKNGWFDGWLVRDDFRKAIVADEAKYGQILARLGLGQGSKTAASSGAYTFPTIIGAAGAVAGAATAVKIMRHRGEPIVPAGDEDDEGGGPPPLWKRLAVGALTMLAYIGALALVGFLIATPVFVLALSWIMRSRHLVRDTLAGVVLTGAVWLLFTRLLFVNLP